MKAEEIFEQQDYEIRLKQVQDEAGEFYNKLIDKGSSRTAFNKAIALAFCRGGIFAMDCHDALQAATTNTREE